MLARQLQRRLRHGNRLFNLPLVGADGADAPQQARLSQRIAHFPGHSQRPLVMLQSFARGAQAVMDEGSPGLEVQLPAPLLLFLGQGHAPFQVGQRLPAGALVDLPSSFVSGKVESFGEQCFGPGPEQGNEGGGIPILAVIPDSASVGDFSDVSIQVSSLGHPNQEPVELYASVVVFPPPDCNANGVDDAMDIADGTSEDHNENTVPDECEVEHGFHGERQLFLPLISDAQGR